MSKALQGRFFKGLFSFLNYFKSSPVKKLCKN